MRLCPSFLPKSFVQLASWTGGILACTYSYVSSEEWSGLNVRPTRKCMQTLVQVLFEVGSVRVAERLVLPTSNHGVEGSNPAGGNILPEPKRRFIAQSLSCSFFHCLQMTEILLKGRKTLTHPSIVWSWLVGYSGSTSPLTCFFLQSYDDGVWMGEGAQCSILKCRLTEVSCHDTTPSDIIPTWGWSVLALPHKSECQGREEGTWIFRYFPVRYLHLFATYPFATCT